ncbi:MAG: zf-HC2 domain-containing protein [Candidatus Korobacteraceae bacterium]
MNRGIPKSARDALANQRPAEKHPSPDLLNGYIEQSLSAAEKAGVTQHLASCEDCREVVFLASAAAAEEPSAAAVAEPARAWRGWKWAVPAVAMLALASSFLVERREWFAPRQAATQTANNKGEAVPSEAAGSQATTESKTPALTYTPALVAKPNQREHARATITNNTTLAHGQSQAAAGARTEPPSGKQDALAELAKAATMAAPPAPAVAVNNATATSSSETAAASPLQTAVAQPPSAHTFGALGHSSFQSMNKTASPHGLAGGSHRALTIRSQWRITAEGHLERLQVGDNWTQVLADQPIEFRAVAVVGNDVWAGGNKGALFHSVDGGEHWTQVLLSADGHPETGAVVSIHFDTVSQGSVGSETGSTWITSDRGQSWNKSPQKTQ